MKVCIKIGQSRIIYSGICPICKQIFYCEHSSSTCGNLCGRRSRRGYQPAQIIQCSQCSKPIKRNQCHLKRHKFQFCSLICSGLFYSADKCPSYKGGTLDDGGYRIVYVKNQRIAEHRLIMSRILGRQLERHEVIHHKNGIRTDNRPENLELCVVIKQGQPRGQRLTDIIKFISDFYPHDMLKELRSRNII